MLLADRQIREEVAAGSIRIDPFEPGHVQPAGIDVRLGREFQVMTAGVEPIDPREDSTWAWEPVTVPEGQSFTLRPGPFAISMLRPAAFVLATTFEHLTLPRNVVARVEGRSSLARLGLVTHATAGFIDPGFTGHVTFELSNAGARPLLLWPGMRVAQLAFQSMTGEAERPYGSAGLQSHYQGQRGPTLSRIHERFDYGLPPIHPERTAA